MKAALMSKTNFGCMGAAIAGTVIVGLLLGMLAGDARSAARRNRCTCHCKQLGLALLNYESTYHCFPPAYVADASGKPMHSWRVLILPYMEEKGLYDRYRFDEPWDGLNNRKLADEMPEGLYSCPAADHRPNETNYVAVVGGETGWPGSGACKKSCVS